MSTNISPNSSSPATVFVCTQCGMSHHPTTGKIQANPQARNFVLAVRKALGANSNVIVRLSRCLGACDIPLAYAFTGEGRETLVFTHGNNPVTPETVAIAARSYQTKRPGTRFQKSDVPLPMHPTVFARIPAPLKPAKLPTKLKD